MGTVSGHQLSTFTTPVNATSPIDANEVRGNDNSIGVSYNAHDADATIHLQTGAVASRPAASTAGAGATWLASDTGAIYLWYSDGSAWAEANYLRNTGGTITSTSTPQLTVAYDASNKLTVAVSSGGVATLTATTSAVFVTSGGTALTLAADKHADFADYVTSTVASSSRNAAFTVRNDAAAQADFIVYGSAVAGSFFGVTKASSAFLLTGATVPLTVGTGGPNALVLGTNDTGRLTFAGNAATATFNSVAVSGITTLAIGGALSGATSISFTTSVSSTTALATPSTLSATQFTAFASTVSGATLMGFGTTGDVTLKNRAGTDVIVVTANTTNVTMAGALQVAGALSGVTTVAASGVVTLTSTGRHQVSGGIQFVANATQGDAGICFETGSGLSLRGKTGSTYDFIVTTPAGSALLIGNPTGTSNLLFGGNITVIGAATSQDAGRLSIGATTQSTVGAAGGASALPATPTGYLKMFLGSSQIVVPYYAQA